MKIVIGHLYYDMMNLYGESGNLNVIKYHLNNQGINCEIKKISNLDDIDFNKLDMIYVGSSTEENRDICLKHFKKYKDDIKKFIESNKFILSTGNSMYLFGKEGINIFDYSINNSKRIVKEVTTKCNFCNNDIYGFINTSDNIDYGNINHLFDNEGIIYNNFYGTYLIGPLLVRNHEFTKYFIKKLIINKDKNFKFKKFNFNLDKKAYTEYIEFKKNKIHIK